MPKIFKLSSIVKGRVQGIGYRWFVQDLAMSMQISGWVKNLDDGSVQIEAYGEKKTLENFLEQLSKHSIAKISSIKADWEDSFGQIGACFDIKF